MLTSNFYYDQMTLSKFIVHIILPHARSNVSTNNSTKEVSPWLLIKTKLMDNPKYRRGRRTGKSKISSFNGKSLLGFRPLQARGVSAWATATTTGLVPGIPESFYLLNDSQCQKKQSVQSDVTELKWYGLVFDKLTNRQTVMHYSKHCPTASVSKWLTARTRKPMTNGLAFSSVQLRRSARALNVPVHYRGQSRPKAVDD